jgi:hypothetical protein
MRRTVLLLFVILVVVMTVNIGRSLPKALAAPQRQQHREESPPPDPALERMQKEAEKQRNEQRQSDLQRDTDQLYKLAGELKRSVDTTNEHVLSLEVIRKAEEIEKLAKSVRTKMKAEGYGTTIH